MDTIKGILQRTDMEMTRSPRDLCAWVNAKVSEFGQTKEGKEYARSGAMLPKKLWEEVRPFGLFALLRYGPEGVKCTPNLSNDNYDGKLAFTNPSTPPLYVELTYAKEGYDEHLRLTVLRREGSVNALGKITVTGTKASGQTIEVENEAVDCTETRNAALALLKERLSGKANKQYGKTHVLIVVVDDYLPFRTDEDKKVLEEQSRIIAAELKLNVGAVYLLGASGKYYARILGEI